MAPGAPGADPRPTGLNLPADMRRAIRRAVQGLDSWFDSARLPDGYGGPAVHWQRDSLGFTGAGLDWRYEGIIIGYLNLWAGTRKPVWLEKATRAGEDLVRGQLPSGSYRNSCFEANPNTRGTPHEAAVNLGLLRLADALRAAGDPAWFRFTETAGANLQRFCIDQLWDANARSFRDDPVVPSFSPDKTATICEAIFAYARVTGDTNWVRRHALPALNVVAGHQIVAGPAAVARGLDGAMYQNSVGGRKTPRFFPLSAARCIPALIEGWSLTGEERYASAAHRAANFLLRVQLADGSFPQVIYPHGRKNIYPRWIAGAGDLLRALLLAQTANVLDPGAAYNPLHTLRWILAGRQSDGSIRTADGFGRLLPGAPARDPRDHIAVAGWLDKAFRVLAILYDVSGPA